MSSSWWSIIAGEGIGRLGSFDGLTMLIGDVGGQRCFLACWRSLPSFPPPLLTRGLCCALARFAPSAHARPRPQRQHPWITSEKVVDPEC
jgi:hypothetical protein